MFRGSKVCSLHRDKTGHAALAAERTLAGHPSRVTFIRIRPGLVHAVTEDLKTGRKLDPSRTGGMGDP